jgi:hypothetical protein
MARKNEWTSPPQPVSTSDGAHHGSYTVDKGMIRVSYKGHSKVTQLGGSAAAPEGLARMILSELVREVADNR